MCSLYVNVGGFGLAVRFNFKSGCSLYLIVMLLQFKLTKIGRETENVQGCTLSALPQPPRAKDDGIARRNGRPKPTTEDATRPI